MEKIHRSLLRIFWIFASFLMLISLSANAGEIKTFLGKAAILTRRTNSEASIGAAGGRYPISKVEQEGSRRTDALDKGVVSALVGNHEDDGAVLGANNLDRLGGGSVVTASIASTSNVMPIPFQLAEGLIYIQASLNGSAPLWVMLDTGSSVTVFDESVSRVLGIRFVGEGKAYGPGQGSSQKLPYARHTTLSFAGVELGDQTVGSLPLEWFSCEIGRSTDGFLGSDVFRNYVVEIDYSNQVLRLYDPSDYSYSGPGQRLPLQFVWNGIPTVHAEVVGSDGTVADGTFLVDSGATTAVWLTKSFNDAHPELFSTQETVPAPSVVAVGGAVNARFGHVFAIRLGGLVVSMPMTQFLENTSGTFAAPGLAGTIGAQMLSRFKVIFDYKHGEMILESHDRFGEPSA